MKKLTVMIILVAFSFTSCKENVATKIKKENLELAKKRDYQMNEGAAVIDFEKKEHDFGVINEGDIVETEFKFKNTGKSELIITKARGSCGCTVPDWPKEPIPVGGEGVIKVKFNSNGKPNNQRKTVTLTANTAKGREVIVIKAQVTPRKKTK